MDVNAIILAAGKGTRMKSGLLKVAHEVAGKSIVGYVVDAVSDIGASNIYVVVGHQAETIKERINHPNATFVKQEEQLGTGHAVQQAVPHVKDDEDVLILVGDAPLIREETLSALKAVKAQCDLALLTVELDDPTGMGRIVRENDNITAIVEHKDATDAQREIKEINTGMMMMSGADLKRWLGDLSNDNAQGEYYLTDVIAMAAAEGKRIQSAQPQSAVEVEGVNNRLQLANLERALQHRQANELMTNGVTLLDPSRFDLRGSMDIGNDIVIDVNVIVEGEVKIGSNVTIGANCILRNCTIADNAVIEANSIIEDAQVGEACVVGPYARLRPGAVMHKNAKVGNFVEMKKAVLGEGAKANHLTYLGDAQVGPNANIGAGTITCNYDGVNKSKTIIGENAFIGSNSSLVAPVSIGDGATVGAGSVITSAVEDKALAVARGKQRNIANWPRPTKKS